MEYWISGYGLPRVIADFARQAEGDGWDGLSIGESPNQLPDTYIQLYAAAAATSRLRLATGVTHPATRLAATTAACIGTLHVESEGRAVLGVGRGDSAHACLGLAPAPLDVFETYVRRVQAYLRGEVVENLDSDGRGLIPPLSSLKLDQHTKTNMLHWPTTNLSAVPIDIAASGPKMIALAAALTGRVSFAVGAERARLEWAVEVARTQHESARSTTPLSLGAYLPLGVDPDRETAWRKVRGVVASFARMSAMHPAQQPRGVTPADRKTYEQIRESYDLAGHFSPSAQVRHIDALPDEFATRFGIAGTAEECVDQLATLGDIGLDRVILVPPADLSPSVIAGRPADSAESLAQRRRLIELLRR